MSVARTSSCFSLLTNMERHTFSSSVILASLLAFALFFVDAAPEPVSLEPPPRPPKGLIPAILSAGFYFPVNLSFQQINWFWYWFNSTAAMKPATGRPCSRHAAWSIKLCFRKVLEELRELAPAAWGRRPRLMKTQLFPTLSETQVRYLKREFNRL